MEFINHSISGPKHPMSVSNTQYRISSNEDRVCFYLRSFLFGGNPVCNNGKTSIIDELPEGVRKGGRNVRRRLSLSMEDRWLSLRRHALNTSNGFSSLYCQALISLWICRFCIRLWRSSLKPCPQIIGYKLCSRLTFFRGRFYWFINRKRILKRLAS